MWYLKLNNSSDTTGFILSLAALIDGSGQSCDDIDPEACSAMAQQNTNMCVDETLANAVCPRFCKRCPITCYNCNATNADLSGCNSITCDSNEICMVKEILSERTGQRKYLLGCANKAFCEGERKRSIAVRSFCVDCCSNDLCNTPRTAQTMASSTTTKTPPSTTTIPPTTIPTQTIPPTTIPTTTIPPTTTETLWLNCARDIIFVVDQSDDFVQQYSILKAFLVDLISRMQIGTSINATEIAWTSFDSVYHYGWSLNEYVDIITLTQAILELKQQRSVIFPSDYADIHQALVYLTHYLQNYDEFHGNRVQNPDVVCFITTSNKTSHSDFEIIYEASKLHNNYLGWRL